MQKYIPTTMMWGIVIILVLIAIFFYIQSAESFSTKREKATRIHEWFTNAGSHNYASYRGALDHKSNIVEYEDVKKLFGGRDFTVATVEAAI